MNLLVKLNLILILVFAVALVPAGMISRNLLDNLTNKLARAIPDESERSSFIRAMQASG